MLISMTGCGTSERRSTNEVVSVSVKVLNSKSLNVSVYLPKEIEEKEWDIRKMVLKEIKRGRVNVHIIHQQIEEAPSRAFLDTKRLAKHLDILKNFVAEKKLVVRDGELLDMTLRMLKEKQTDSNLFKESVWKLAKKGLKDSFAACHEFRKKEGTSTLVSLKEYLQNMEGSLKKISGLEKKREEDLRQRLNKRLEDHLSKKSPNDQHRLEQEVFYYMERNSFEEEKVRLQQNLAAFIETLTSKKKTEKGKNYSS